MHQNRHTIFKEIHRISLHCSYNTRIKLSWDSTTHTTADTINKFLIDIDRDKEN